MTDSSDETKVPESVFTDILEKFGWRGKTMHFPFKQGKERKFAVIDAADLYSIISIVDWNEVQGLEGRDEAEG